MKLFLVMAIVALGNHSFACEPKEAQFIGTVSELKTAVMDSKEVCYFKVTDITFFNSSMICPLTQEDVIQQPILDTHCSIELGQKASGVLVYQNQTLFLD